MNSTPERIEKRAWLQTTLEIAVVIAVIGGCALLFRANSGARPDPDARARALVAPAGPLSLSGTAVRGDRRAKVAIVEYSDFQCPFCRAFARETLPSLDERYLRTGKVLFAFRHMPLQEIHPSAIKAAESAECANRQGRFWEMHDALFKGGADLSDASVRATARRLGLAEAHFDACLAGQATERIRQDLADATALGIVGTPTFFLGTIQPDGRVKVTQVLSGNRGMTEFEAALDKLLDAPQRAER